MLPDLQEAKYFYPRLTGWMASWLAYAAFVAEHTREGKQFEMNNDKHGGRDKTRSINGNYMGMPEVKKRKAGRW